MARTHPTLLRRIEHQLEFLIAKNSDFAFEEGAIVPNLVFPAMGPAQRKLVHLVAESYGLHSESFGDADNRSVWVTLKPNAKVPGALLSRVLEEHQAEAEAKGYRASECGVLLSQMSPSLKTSHLQEYLREWANQSVIHWLDEHSCLVVFDDPSIARVALNTLKGPFVATIFRETSAQSAPAPETNVAGAGGDADEWEALKPAEAIEITEPVPTGEKTEK